MAELAPVKIRHSPTRTYHNFQRSFCGAQDQIERRGWWPQTPVANNEVLKTCIFGRYLVALGSFTVLGGLSRAGFAAVDIPTGMISALWNPEFTGGVPLGLATDGTYLYVSGNFTAVDGVTHSGLCRFDYNGVVDPTWLPVLNANSYTDTMLYNPTRGSLVLAGYSLALINSTARQYLGEVLTTDGSVTAWDPAPNDQVLALALDSTAGTLYLGGDFTSIAATGRNRLAAVTASTVALQAWNPNANGTVYAILLDGGLVYAAGAFTNIVSTTRNRAACLTTAATAALTTWNPNLNGDVMGLGVYRSTVFLAGAFTQVGATTRNRLAAVTTAGVLDDWNPAADAALAGLAVLDRTVFCHGSFTTINGLTQGYLGAVPFPIFTDSNTKYISALTGSDAAAGTAAAPYATIGKGLATMASAFKYAVITDSESYNEKINWNVANTGLFAADGFTPIIEINFGAKDRTYGARKTRTATSAGAGSTFFYVSKAGNDATGARGNVLLPYKTIGAAILAGSRQAGDTIQIQDSGEYNGLFPIGALAVTIQAAIGQTPLLYFVTASTMFSGTGDLTLYGLTLKQPQTPPSIIINTTGAVLAQDCTFSGYNGIMNTNAAKTVTLTSCLFLKVEMNVVNVYGTLVATNCYFKNCAGGGVSQCITIQAAATNATVTKCTFENIGYNSNGLVAAIQANKAGSPAGADVVSFCHFFNSQASKPFSSGVIYSQTGAFAGYFIVRDCLFEDLGGYAFYASTTSLTTTLLVGACFAFRCTQHALATRGVFLSIDSNISFNNCASIGSFHDGFWAETSSISNVTSTFTNCTALNSKGTGFASQNGTAKSLNFTLVGCLAAGSGSGYSIRCLQSTQITNLSLSLFQEPWSLVTYPSFTNFGNFVGDSPKLISSVGGVENAAFYPNSPCFLSGTYSDFSASMGIVDNFFRVSAAGVQIDGMTFKGAANLYAGLTIGQSLTAGAYVNGCSFLGLGLYGLMLASGSLAERCLFETNGIGIVLVNTSDSVRRCLGQNCASAFIVSASSNHSIKNNTGVGCAYGQYDMAGTSQAEMKNAVYSGNTILDYSGPGPLSNSCVPTVVVDQDLFGNMDTSPELIACIRLNPNFRSVTEPDLRINAIAEGSLFDSPALGIGDDAGDAGAFDFYYGPVLEAWTTLDLATAGWRNPDHVRRPVFIYKVSEGETFAPATYSQAAGSTIEHELSWEGSNDMPAAQAAALIALFIATSSECQLSFDGGTTWIPCRLLKSQAPATAELEGLTYAEDTVPRPLDKLTFREST